MPEGNTHVGTSNAQGLRTAPFGAGTLCQPTPSGGQGCKGRVHLASKVCTVASFGAQPSPAAGMRHCSVCGKVSLNALHLCKPKLDTSERSVCWLVNGRQSSCEL